MSESVADAAKDIEQGVEPKPVDEGIPAIPSENAVSPTVGGRRKRRKTKKSRKSKRRRRTFRRHRK